MGHDLRAPEVVNPRMDARTARVAAAVDTNASDVLGYFARRVDQPEDAADLLSETFLVIWRRASSLPPTDAEMRPWIFGIARKVLLRHYRHTTRQHALADRVRTILSVTPHPGFHDPSEHPELHEAIARLDRGRPRYHRPHPLGGLLARRSKSHPRYEGRHRPKPVSPRPRVAAFPAAAGASTAHESPRPLACSVDASRCRPSPTGTLHMAAALPRLPP
ncbi:sigma-70 family RNA polymerase sigma factor [Microbacterium lushaniae]|uniref:Sigma-70 family RNA polymerase sigma factor n=1 Tax=Microbacterium lushaniae TaxID=2614639 RepID=A0A5J6L0A8_9MICO|nr:sigma-70 family RNA polymerase sigma factor [Microbacterium lushaniae]